MLRFATMSIRARLLPGRFFAIVAALMLAGCGSFTLDADGIDGFSPSSQVWQIETTNAANRHTFVLTNISGYCRKKMQAEQDQTDANARNEERLAGGAGLCESEDQRLDDLAAAFGPLQRDGASYLFVNIAREEATNTDAATAPEAGEYRQEGSALDGRFDAQYLRYMGKLAKNTAEAYTCLNPEDADIENFTEFLTQDQPELLEFWALSAGILTVDASGDDAWRVGVTGDLLDGSDTVGGLESSFVASRCEVPVEDLTE